MAAFVLLLLVAMATAHPAAATLYCLCNFGVNSTVLQNNIAFACGNGADCSAIAPNGACYYPNTLADHCNYAWNSYFHNSQAPGSCHTDRMVILTLSPPVNSAPGCVYPTSGPRVVGDTSMLVDDYNTASATLPSIGLSFMLIVWFFFLM